MSIGLSTLDNICLLHILFCTVSYSVAAIQKMPVAGNRKMAGKTAMKRQ